MLIGLCGVCQFLNLQLPPIDEGHFKKYQKVKKKKEVKEKQS